MPNSALLLNCLCFGAQFLQEARLTTEVFTLAFLARVCAVAIATGLVKNKAKKVVSVYLKEIQSLDCFHR